MSNNTSANNDSIKLYKDKASQWRWRRVSTNGRIVGASSEGYSRKSACKDNAQRQFSQCTITQD